MERKYVYELIKLAQLGAFYKPILISTSLFAKELKTTQQNASIKLIKLEEEGYITRKTSRRGQEITLTKKGRDLILEVYSGLKGVIEGKKEVIVKGIVQKGIGEGGYYISLEGYAKQFEEKLGYRPFPGTLNIKLIEPKSRGFLNNFTGIFISGFSNGKRTYGWVKCFPAIINNKLDCHVILLERTIHPRNIIEVISKYHLKKELGIKEGDIVEIKVIPQ